MPSPGQARSAPLDPPPIGATLAARALNILAWVLAPLLVIPIVHNAVHGRWLAVTLLASQEIAIAAALLLKRSGQPRGGALVLTSAAWLVSFALATCGGDGTRDVVLFALPPILLAAGVLVGRRYLWCLTGLTIVALSALWLAEDRGWIQPATALHPEFTTILDASVILIVAATATTVLTNDLRRTLDSEMRHAAALERSELHFRTAIELAADGILLADDEARVTEANSRVCGMLGHKRGELIGQSLHALFPGDACTDGKDTRERVDRGEIVTCERTIRRAQAADLVVEITWQRLPDRSMQCFVRDISPRRRLEEQLRQAQKMEAVGALAGGIAHDFNNLITVMKGFLELIEADASLSGELAENVAELKVTTMHAAELTQQLLAFAGRQPLERRTTDVRDLLATNQRLMARLAGDAIKVVIEPLSTPCPVFVDPVLFTQVLLNLAANSRDAMPSGGRITVAALAPSARSPARPGTGGFVVRDYTGIRFSDTGAGIPADALTRVFEPFFTTKEAGRNAGLGLAMVHGIVDRHGGWVEVESAAGRGTTFSLFLPVHAPVEPGSPAESGSAPAAAGRTILVVDDDAGVRRLARHALAQSGYTILEADSGPEALDTWREHGGTLDLVFTDMVMPGGMNGLQLIQECRARQPGVPAILTSGYTLPPLDAATPADVVMLAKPYANAVLLDAVRTLVAGRTPPARGRAPQAPS